MRCIYYLLKVLCFLFLPVAAIDDFHFYRASFFLGEPRFERPWLTSFDIQVGGGKTSSSFNGQQKKVPLLSIYGPQNMIAFAKGVPDLNPSNPYDAILINLTQLRQEDTFGLFALQGKFNVIEGVISAYQNITDGFFVQAYIPIRSLEINPELRTSTDIQDTALFDTTRQQETWRIFFNNFNTILEHNNIMIEPQRQSGFGDFSLLGGWASTFQNTCHVDFVDVATKIGLLFPTSKKQSLKNPFVLPLGYNGHWGSYLSFDLSCGLCEWITFGGHLSGLFLAHTTEHIRMKTSQDQQGFLVLAHGDAKVNPGIYFDLNCFCKADHIVKGVSFLLGYSYNLKRRDNIHPTNTHVFNYHIVNNDARFAGWNQHVFHIILEYDAVQNIAAIGPRIGLVYNHIIQGKRIFDTNMLGGYLGIDVAWQF